MFYLPPKLCLSFLTLSFFLHLIRSLYLRISIASLTALFSHCWTREISFLKNILLVECKHLFSGFVCHISYTGFWFSKSCIPLLQTQILALVRYLYSQIRLSGMSVACEIKNPKFEALKATSNTEQKSKGKFQEAWENLWAVVQLFTIALIYVHHMLHHLYRISSGFESSMGLTSCMFLSC